MLAFRDRLRVLTRIINNTISVSENVYKGWIKSVNETVAVNLSGIFQNIFQSNVFQTVYKEALVLLTMRRVLTQSVNISESLPRLISIKRVITSTVRVVESHIALQSI